MNYDLIKNNNITLNIDDFSQDKLVSGKNRIMVTDKTNGQYKPITVDSYILPGYEAFSIRECLGQWVLSVRGRMLTYGSYEHITDVMILLMQIFTCWHSESSLVYFLSLPDYAKVISEIARLRMMDHSMKQS